MVSMLVYIHLWSKFSVQYHLDFYSIYVNMNTTDNWPMAREYLVWNAAIAALQFWTADLKAHTLSGTIEEVYSAFFYTASVHTLCQQPDKILFGCFVTTLNGAFEWKLALEDEGYKSGSENFNIPNSIDPPCVQCWECFIWSRSSYTMQYWTVSPQTSMQTANI